MPIWVCSSFMMVDWWHYRETRMLTSVYYLPHNSGIFFESRALASISTLWSFRKIPPLIPLQTCRQIFAHYSSSSVRCFVPSMQCLWPRTPTTIYICCLRPHQSTWDPIGTRISRRKKLKHRSPVCFKRAWFSLVPVRSPRRFCSWRSTIGPSASASIIEP